MTKQQLNPTPSIVQDKIPNINHSDFNFESEFCSRINKIRGIADLFFAERIGESRCLTENGCNGIHYVLEDCAEELRAICYKMLKWEGGAK